jgi:hypothetical protein
MDIVDITCKASVVLFCSSIIGGIVGFFFPTVFCTVVFYVIMFLIIYFPMEVCRRHGYIESKDNFIFALMFSICGGLVGFVIGLCVNIVLIIFLVSFFLCIVGIIVGFFLGIAIALIFAQQKYQDYKDGQKPPVNIRIEISGSCDDKSNV